MVTFKSILELTVSVESPKMKKLESSKSLKVQIYKALKLVEESQNVFQVFLNANF